MNYSKFLYVVTFATVLFTACGNDSSTSANNSNDDISSKSSSSQRSVSSSSNKVTEPVEVTVGSMKDSRDGHTYKTVTIGSQTWMAENLNYKADSSWCGGGNELNEGDCSKYGRLYTWAAAMDSAGTWSSNGKGCGYGKTCSPTYPVRGICPKGWHVPTKTDITNLVGKGVGITTKTDAPYYDGANGSIKLLNEDGFKMFPCGMVSINNNTVTAGTLSYTIYEGRIAAGMMIGSTQNGSVTYNVNGDATSGLKNISFCGLMPMTNKATEAEYTCNGTNVSYRIAGALRCVRND